ncbi:hypothetical protein ACERII_12410 [Evansella sp. AB-rgal1]|uniref:hypothetical protein n=1 Tax=Evansella sp. AB-rgal1 TaxID=3242696 RepID=UPI00359E34FD
MPDSLRQHVDTRYADGSALNQQFNFLNSNNISAMIGDRQWRNPLNMDWMKSSVRGGGLVGLVLISLSNIYDYSPWGNNSNIGYVSTDFTTAILTDLTLGATTTAITGVTVVKNAGNAISNG